MIIKERVVIRERPVYRDYPVPVREYRHFDDRSVRYSRDPAVVIGVSIPPLIFPLR